MKKDEMLNPALDEDIEEISDSVVKGICLFALHEAQDAFNRGESQPQDFVSKRLGSSITRLVRGQ